MIKKISITGGMGSGKSTVIQYLSQLGYCVWDADIFSASAIAQPHVEEQIKHIFGDHAYCSPGILNRAFVREQVFQHPDLKNKLEEIIHPVIEHMLSQRLNKMTEQGVSCWIFYEASLIFEKKRHDFFDANILVIADDEKRIKRVRKTKKLPIDLIHKIMAQQMPTAQKLKMADYVIKNSGTHSDLEKNVLKLIQFLKRKFKK